MKLLNKKPIRILCFFERIVLYTIVNMNVFVNEKELKIAGEVLSIYGSLSK